MDDTTRVNVYLGLGLANSEGKPFGPVDSYDWLSCLLRNIRAFTSFEVLSSAVGVGEYEGEREPCATVVLCGPQDDLTQLRYEVSCWVKLTGQECAAFAVVPADAVEFITPAIRLGE